MEPQEQEGDGIEEGQQGVLPGADAGIGDAHAHGDKAEGRDAQAQEPEDPQQVLQEEGLAAEAHLAHLFAQGAGRKVVLDDLEFHCFPPCFLFFSLYKKRPEL